MFNKACRVVLFSQRSAQKPNKATKQHGCSSLQWIHFRCSSSTCCHHPTWFTSLLPSPVRWPEQSYINPYGSIAVLQNLLWVLGVLGVMGGGLRGVGCWREELWSKVSLLSPNWRLFGLWAFPDVLCLKQRVNKAFRSQQSCCTRIRSSDLSQRHQDAPGELCVREKGALRWNHSSG